MSPPAGAAVAAPLPSLEANFVPACRREGLLSRPELQRMLDRQASKPLLLVSAPCGYGKTSLLATWALRKPREQVAWLTLEAADDHGVRFWSKVGDAIDRVRPGLVGRSTSYLRARGTSVE